MQAVATVEEEDVLVTMGEEMLMTESELHRDIPFEQIGLDEVTLESQFTSQNHIPLYTDPALAGSVKFVDRSTAHIPLNELGKRLLMAARSGDAEEVKTLMAKGAPFTCDWLGTSALHLAAQHNNVEVADILLHAGISRDSRTKVDKTALHLASTAGNAIITQMLLHSGTDVNALDMLRMTPLHWAVDRAHTEVIRVLLEFGANPRIRSKFNKTAFSIAADKHRPDLIQLIRSVKPVPDLGLLQQMDSEMERATLAATHSLTNEMAQVPTVCQQEEVETSATGKYDAHKFFVTEDYLATKEILLQHAIHIEEEPQVGPNETLEEDLVPTTNTMQYLQAHGITLLPLEEECSLTEVAMESGGRVVLTEAGKLAMHLTNEEIPKRLGKSKLHRKQYGSKHAAFPSSGNYGMKAISNSNIRKRMDFTIDSRIEPLDGDLLAKKKRNGEDTNSAVYQYQIREATLKAEEAERLALEAQQYSEEWRQKATALKEQLGKSQRQNEHYKQLIESLRKRRH